jgi:hypothetical protein
VRADTPTEAIIIDGIIICQDVERSLVAMLQKRMPIEESELVAAQILVDNLQSTITKLLPGDVPFRQRGCH